MPEVKRRIVKGYKCLLCEGDLHYREPQYAVYCGHDHRTILTQEKDYTLQHTMSADYRHEEWRKIPREIMMPEF